MSYPAVEQETIREFIEASFEGRVGQFLLVLLLTMSASSIAVTVERILTFQTARRRSRTFERHVGMPMRGMSMDEAISLGLRHNGPRASVIVCGLIAFKHATSLASHADASEAAKRAARLSASMIRSRMRRRLHWLATTISTAALLGFLATVWGFLFGFKGAVGSLESIRAAQFKLLSYHLVPAALGFLISVSMMWVHRYLKRQVELFDLEMKASSLELLNYLSLTSKESATF